VAGSPALPFSHLPVKLRVRRSRTKIP
jgi:hypothetical protein